MTEELRKQASVDDAVAAGLVEETAAVAPELDEAAKLQPSARLAAKRSTRKRTRRGRARPR